MKTALQAKVLFMLRNQSEKGFVFVLAETTDSPDGYVVEKVDSAEGYVVYQIQNKCTISTAGNLVDKVMFKCYKEGLRYYIHPNEYNSIIQEINRKKIDFPQNYCKQENSSEDSDSGSSNSQSILSSDDGNRLRPDISEGDSEDRAGCRRRGRPKGAKNKKTQQREKIMSGMISLESIFNPKISSFNKRGKGRPKGSKNKRKDYCKQEQEVKLQEFSSQQGIMPFGKRGKGRPKGSKNRIKALDNLPDLNDDQFLEKRGRGRPKGAKNKSYSTPSQSNQHSSNLEVERLDFQRPDEKEFRDVVCCRRCQQREMKRKIIEGEVEIDQIQQQLFQVSEDYSMQNKMNLLVEAINLGDWATLDLLLARVTATQAYFQPPWDPHKAIGRTQFCVRTKKDFLSKTGKQGIYALMHDCHRKHRQWWKEITVERIIQNIPSSEDGIQVLKRLMASSSELREELLSNLPSFIRNGNRVISESILTILLAPDCLNRHGFCKEYENLLIGNPASINQLKKADLIQQSKGPNFCSPVHCAAISADPQFLNKLLMTFTDVINIEDSLLRKPVHYAAVCQAESPETSNLAMLVGHGAELKEVDRRRLTPLMLACAEGEVNNVIYILQKVRDPEYINFRSQEGYTALHYAVLKNHLRCVEVMINDPLVDIETKSSHREDVFHLVAGTDNSQIFSVLINKHMRPAFSVDKFKRTPAVIAVRNHNNRMLYWLLEHGCKHEKADSSLNTLLHYAAAYGNVEAVVFLRKYLVQSKNKKGLYPWQIAIYKGHLKCAMLMGHDGLSFEDDPLYILLSSIRGTFDFLQLIEYVISSATPDINYRDKITGNSYLHLACSLGQEEYRRVRSLQADLSTQQIRQEFLFIQEKLIDYLLASGVDSNAVNKKGELPLKMCIQNSNLISFQKLLNAKLPFELESASGNTIMHCLSNLACQGFKEMQFVEKKLRAAPVNSLKTHIKKSDRSGFDFLLYFVRDFAFNARRVFVESVSKLMAKGNKRSQAESQSFEEFVQYENQFLNMVSYLVQMGCDVNGQVLERRNVDSQLFRKWGIQHFCMNFPSLKIVSFFKTKIRDFNAPNNRGMTPLHLFCINNKAGNLLPVEGMLPREYRTECVLDYLLSSNLNPNCYDCDKALPILYATLNCEHKFIVKLLENKSQINFCTSKNKVPLIEIIRRSDQFGVDQIEQLLRLGAKPNFVDMDKRNSLHHLVASSSNFDSSPQICKLLLDHHTKVNALDKYDRSPIFYCFTPIDGERPEDKVQILQLLLSCKDINLNLLDVYDRTLLHYACQRNFFFSILYLLDKNINMETKDYQDNTPLAVSLKHKNLDQAALLIKKGVKYGYVNDGIERLSYFCYAIKKLSVGICFMLLDQGYPIQRALEEVQNEAFKQILKKKYIK